MVDGQLWEHLWVSSQEFAIGMAIAAVSGILIGFATGVVRILDLSLTPWLAWFYAVPRVALIPILLVWFGLGLESKIAIVTLMGFFPIALNAAAGARTVDRRLLEMAAAFSVPRLLVFRAVIIPSSVPYVLTGVRLGIGSGLIGVVVGELFASRAGLGFLLVQAGYTFNAPRIFAMVFVLSGIGLVLTLLTSTLERRFEAWRT
jgi:NitT/TauT family transport system permease protein